MRLTKRQSLVAAFCVLALFFTLATMIAGRSSDNGTSEGPVAEVGPSPALAPAGADLASGGSKVVLNEFHRSETRNGQKLWEVSAKQGQYLPEKNIAELYDARLMFFRKVGEVVTLEAKRADLSFNGYSLAKAELMGGLVLSFKDEVTVETETASYDQATNGIRAPGKVKIRHALAEIDGEGLTADIATGRVSLEGSVETMLRPRSAVRSFKK